MTKFTLGQIVKQNYGAVAHYAIVVAENRTIGWVNTSKLEVKHIEGEGWESVKIEGKTFDFKTIKNNIKSFKKDLETGKARQYHPTEFNCEHWATLMVTGKAYSTQSSVGKLGTAGTVAGGMVCVGASAGTVVTVASTLGAAASTGTAIGSLSGAAATNAALAWLGGGSLAAGGGGMAAGAAIISAVSTGGAVIAIAGIGVIGKQVWDNLSEAQREAIAKKIDNSTPEQVKIAYGVTVEKAVEQFNLASGWLGERTSELAQSVDRATPPQVKDALDKIAQFSQNAGEKVTQNIENAVTFTQEKTAEVSYHLDNAVNAVGSWWDGLTTGKNKEA